MEGWKILHDDHLFDRNDDDLQDNLNANHTILSHGVWEIAKVNYDYFSWNAVENEAVPGTSLFDDMINHIPF